MTALLSGCVIPFAIPPTRGELGESSNRALHVGGGAHLASGVQRKNLPVDIGVGGFVDITDDHPNVVGGYLDGAVFTERHVNTRTSFGMRGELRSQAGQLGGGAKLRIDHELYGAVYDQFTEDDRCGFVTGSHYGNAAAGVFVEAGRIWQPDGTAWVATAGLTVRLPSVAGVYVGIPGC